jgi:DNA replication licensing factor MCM2
MNKLVNISGVVTKRTSVLPCLRKLFLDCLRCGFLIGPFEVKESDGSADIKAGRCPECQNTGPFSVNREETVYRNFQKIVVQETPGSVPAGRMPRSKEVVITGDLVDSVRPGDQVEVIGIFKSKLDGLANIRSGFPVLKSHIEANGVKRRNELKMGSLGEEDKREILELSKDPNIRDRLIATVAPSIYGEKHMKTCVSMAMFGGRQKTVAGKHRIRGDINILILGDPGMAKSQCLKYVEKTFHRTVYTTGKGASAVGLTASVRKDNITGEYVLEGGALVLADSGICLIDEFDKMNDQDRTSIHEAMEQQSISISKAGIVTSLSARCAVIAAANPIGGRYDPQLTFSENVDLTDPILSRFDCLCVLKDDIDVFKDEALADFVVCSHMKNHPTEPNEQVRVNRRVQLQNGVHASLPPIDQELYKKYVLYARLHVNPTISEVDQNKLARFYMEIRREAAANQGVAMTVRHMESMIRMAEANARMELRDFVTDKDVDQAIATMLETFIQTQKHSVAERLRRKFEATYITSVTAHSDLLHFLMKKLLKKKLDFHAVMAAEGVDDEEEIGVPIQEFKAEAQKMDLASVNEYLQSETFLESFDVREGYVYRKQSA